MQCNNKLINNNNNNIFSKLRYFLKKIFLKKEKNQYESFEETPNDFKKKIFIDKKLQNKDGFVNGLNEKKKEEFFKLYEKCKDGKIPLSQVSLMNLIRFNKMLDYELEIKESAYKELEKAIDIELEKKYTNEKE